MPGFYLALGDLPAGFSYPQEYVRFCEENGPTWRLNTWGFFQDEHLEPRSRGLKARYPSRTLVPFARSWTNDDVACFELVQDCVRIAVVHDYASSGWEDCGSFTSLAAFLASVDLAEAEWLES